MGLGISYQDKALEFSNAKTASLRKAHRANGTKKTAAPKAADNGDVLSLSHNSGCTDGKDDGKIGFFSAIGNAIVGVGKGVVNAVKGCFTGKDGKFSLGKTLLSVGTAALCVAFPAVGLVACGVGAVAGGVQVAKGAVKAANAKTDAEAKEAWQNIGAGGATVAASVAGAKASYGAVMKTSTAGATAALGKDASIGQRAAALGKDMISSTKNSAANIKAGVTTAKEAAELANARRKAGKIDQSGALTDAEMSQLKNLEVREAFASDKARAMADKVPQFKKPTMADVKTAASKAGQNVKAAPGKVLKTVKNIKSADIKGAITGLPAKAQAIIADIKNAPFNEVVAKYGYEDVIAAMETFAGYRMADEAI